MRIAAPVLVQLEAGSRLDFVIGGSLQVDNTLSFGGGSTWLAVGGDVHIASPADLTGYLYAPSAKLSADNTLDVTCALFVGELRVASPITTALPGIGLPACAPAE